MTNPAVISVDVGTSRMKRGRSLTTWRAGNGPDGAGMMACVSLPPDGWRSPKPVRHPPLA